MSLRTKWNSDLVTWIGLEGTTLHAEKTEKLPDSTSERNLQQSNSKRKMVAQGSEMKNGICSLQTLGFIWYGDPAQGAVHAGSILLTELHFQPRQQQISKIIC